MKLALSLAASAVAFNSAKALNIAQEPEPQQMALPEPEPVVPDRGANWRHIFKATQAANPAHPSLSRQEARALQRRVTKLEAAEMRLTGRVEDRLERKSRRRKARAANAAGG